MKDISVAILVVIAFAAIVFWPVVLFWAIGVLFDFHIDFGFKTWVAAWVIALMVNAGDTGASR